MPAPHGKLFAAIVLGGTTFGASACYMSHEVGPPAVRVVVDAGRDAPPVADAGHDAGSDLGPDLGADLGADLGTAAGCAVGSDAGVFDCVACGAIDSCRPTCSCAPFCCFI